MKMKNIIKVGIVLALGSLFVGCADHNLTIAKKPFDNNSMIQTLIFEVPEKGAFNAENRNLANTFGLQVAAEATLRNGYRYFAIKSPKGAVSNYYGSLVNTPKDFIKTCNTNSTGKELGASLLTLGLINFTIKDHCHITTSNAGNGKLTIISYKEQPVNITSYDAKVVLDYIKKKKLYMKIPKGETVENLVK